jgi:hypothetical protein
MTHHSWFDYFMDVSWASILLGVFLGWLPHITAILAFILVLVRLYETATVRAALERLRQWRSG